MYDAILLPTDGSAGASRATEHALALAKRHGAALHVLYVVDEGLHGTTPALGTDELALEKLDERGRTVVEEIQGRATAEQIVAVCTCNRGDPEREIERYVAEHEIDLVVMGLHGTGARGTPHVGSTTDHVMRTVGVPVEPV